MKFELLDKPDFGLLRVRFEASGERIVAESGAMVSMSSGVRLETAARGGLLSAAKRKVLGGESFFQNTFTAESSGQELLLAPSMEGDVVEQRLGMGEEILLAGGNYLAHTGDQLSIDTKFAGVKGLFSSTGLFLLKITGPGTVFFNAYGALHEVAPGPDGYVVDNDHIVGFTSGLDYEITRFNGTKGLFASGEGLVCRFRGQGRLWLQTRNPRSLASFLDPFRPEGASLSDTVDAAEGVFGGD